MFKLDTAGNFSVLYSFSGLSDGGNPEGGVVLDAAGNLYRTTLYGGIGYPGAGVVFKIDAGGRYSVLHAFLAYSDGGYPHAGVTLDSAGNIYGTCSGYGPQGAGTVYQLDSAGTFSVVYAFGASGGGGPVASVVRSEAGSLYGTLPSNGPFCRGTRWLLRSSLQDRHVGRRDGALHLHWRRGRRQPGGSRSPGRCRPLSVRHGSWTLAHHASRRGWRGVQDHPPVSMAVNSGPYRPAKPRPDTVSVGTVRSAG